MSEEDLRRLRAAEGWLDLGLPQDAVAELNELPDELKARPATLMLLWRVHAENGHWQDAADVGASLVKTDPKNVTGWIHRSYALHELKRTAEAEQQLLPALKQFPKEEIIPYNLACYACQLGRHDEAKALLRIALLRGDPKEIRERALHDPDLAPIRKSLNKL